MYAIFFISWLELHSASVIAEHVHVVFIFLKLEYFYNLGSLSVKVFSLSKFSIKPLIKTITKTNIIQAEALFLILSLTSGRSLVLYVDRRFDLLDFLRRHFNLNNWTDLIRNQTFWKMIIRTEAGNFEEAKLQQRVSDR